MRRRLAGVDVRAALAASDRDFVARVVGPFYARAGLPLDPAHLARAEAIDAGLPVEAHGWEINAPDVSGRYRLHPDGTITEPGGQP